MSRYPFQPGIKGLERTAYQLKVLSVAGGVSAPEMIRQVVDYVYRQADQLKLKAAEEAVGRFVKKVHM